MFVGICFRFQNSLDSFMLYKFVIKDVLRQELCVGGGGKVKLPTFVKLSLILWLVSERCYNDHGGFGFSVVLMPYR